MSSVFTRLFILLFISIFISSCASKKDIVYFQDVGNYETLVDENESVTRFKVDDLVAIYVSSLNSEASAPFNLFRIPPGAGTSIQAAPIDFIVDDTGEIDFPVLGKLKIKGLTTEELRILLTDELSVYLKDPIINIRLVNFRVTVLGEVRTPGTFAVGGQNQQITILEALGLAGDLTPRGVRDNVLVIRDFNGTKVYTRIDLTSKNFVKSPVYFLTQNDVIYVEPNKAGISASALDVSTKASIAITLISVLITSTVIILTR